MKPTGSWSYCEFVTREGWINECKYLKHIFWTADESSNRRKILAVSTQLKQLRRSCDPLFDLSSARAPRQTPPRRLQALVGEHARRQTHLHRNRTTVLTLTMRPSTRCCPRLSSGWAEMTRKHSVLWEISGCYGETPDKESFSRVAKFFQNRRRDSGSRAENYASFRRVRGLGYMTVSKISWRQCTRMIHLTCFQGFLKWYTCSCSVTYYIVFCRTIIQCVAQIENVPRQHRGATTCQYRSTH